MASYHSRPMGDKYAGPSSYMATDAENQNNALAGGAQNIMDPNWNKMKYKKETIRDFVPNTKMARAKYADKAPKIGPRVDPDRVDTTKPLYWPSKEAPKINVRKAYQE